MRTQQWEASKVWSSRNVTAESVVDEHRVAATITALKKLEGLLILYGNKIDEYSDVRYRVLLASDKTVTVAVREITGKNIDALATMAEIKESFKRVERMIKIVKIAIPRYEDRSIIIAAFPSCLAILIK